MLKKRCKITFVVHGSTIYTAANRFYEVGEYPPLDDNGREEIERLTMWLKKRSPKTDKIYTAPTLRSIQSANIISKSYEQSFEIIEDLITKDEGVWGGLSFSEILICLSFSCIICDNSLISCRENFLSSFLPSTRFK